MKLPRLTLLLTLALALTAPLATAQTAPPGPPTSAASAMFTLEDLWNRLKLGTPGTLRTGSFAEPTGAPGVKTMHTLNELMGAAPSVDDANGATAGQVLTGTTFWGLRSGGWGLLSGAMANNGAVTIAPGATAQTIPAGYHNGSGTVATDANLVTGNIKAGVTVFGVAGSTNVVDTSSGDVVAADIPTGKKAWVKGVEITGTAPMAPQSVTFSYNGTAKDHRGTFYGTDGSAQTWTVPAGVTSVTIECWGAQGGGNPTNGGQGGYAKGTLAVTAGQAFQIWVGGQSGILNSGGFSGGVSGTADTDMKGYGFPGGGKSTVQLNGQSIITAGGGGGAALNLWNGYLGSDLWISGGSGGGPEGSGFFFTTNAAGGDGGGEPPYSPGRANLYTGRGGPGYLNPTLTNASMASGMRTGHGQVVITYVNP